jgi:hypothetical protein
MLSGAGMPNKFLTIQEVSQFFFEDMKVACGDDVIKQRAWFYDMQTWLGGFPCSEEERNRYIATGSTKKVANQQKQV